MKGNFTPIDDLVKKHKTSSSLTKSKEAEPIPSKREKFEIKEAVEHKAEEGVEPFLTTRPETIEIPPDLQKMGVQAAGTTQFPSWQTVKTPLSDDKILTGLHAPITSSLRWLAELARYLLLQAHTKLKIVRGKIVRVITS